MVRKDAIDASALCLYRKPEAALPERPLFMEAPLSEAPDEVQRTCSMQRLPALCYLECWHVLACGCVASNSKTAISMLRVDVSGLLALAGI